MSIVLQSSGGGSVTIQEPVTASNLTITLPTSSGTAVITGTTPTLNGITFPATQVPSADANTLDDYEEGTWTPTDTSGAGLSFVNNGSTYTKIGRAVTLNFEIVYPTTANASNSSISLPINSVSGNRAGLAVFSNLAGENNIYIEGGGSFTLYNDVGTRLTNANLSGKFLIVSITYFAS